MRASAAWILPTCLCSSPERERMNTSNSGQSVSLMLLSARACRKRVAGVPRGVRQGGLAHPATGLVGAATRLEALAVARAMTLEHCLELAPVDRSDPVVLPALVPVQLVVGDGEAE